MAFLSVIREVISTSGSGSCPPSWYSVYNGVAHCRSRFRVCDLIGSATSGFGTTSGVCNYSELFAVVRHYILSFSSDFNNPFSLARFSIKQTAEGFCRREAGRRIRSRLYTIKHLGQWVISNDHGTRSTYQWFRFVVIELGVAPQTVVSVVVEVIIVAEFGCCRPLIICTKRTLNLNIYRAYRQATLFLCQLTVIGAIVWLRSYHTRIAILRGNWQQL